MSEKLKRYTDILGCSGDQYCKSEDVAALEAENEALMSNELLLKAQIEFLKSYNEVSDKSFFLILKMNDNSEDRADRLAVMCDALASELEIITS